MDENPSICFLTQQPSVIPAATVLSVSDLGDGEHFRWTFNKVVTGVGSMNAFLINGLAPDHDFSFSGSTATGGYSSPINFGDPWTVAAGTAGITFAAGAICTPGQSGTTT
jgi:hypothetical protein